MIALRRWLIIFACAPLVGVALLWAMGSSGQSAQAAPIQPSGSIIRAAVEPPDDEDSDDESTSTTTPSKKKESDEGAAKPSKEDAGDKGKEAPSKPKPASAKKPTPSKTAKKETSDQLTPDVEVYIPSVAGLADAAKRSKTNDIYRGLSGLLAPPENETGEGLDAAGIIRLLKQIASWPDTSVSAAVYSQDRDGRPRWAVRLDWPLEDLHRRVAELLKDDAAKTLMKEVAVRPASGGRFKIELPDTVLAVLSKSGSGSVIASAADVTPPETVFGQKGRASDEDATKKGMLVYCRLNMEAGSEDEKKSSVFSSIAGVSDIRYGASLGADGLWSERFNVRWSPFLGLAIKQAVQKTDGSFSCPADSFAFGAIQVGLSESMADTMAGLPAGTIGSRAENSMAFAVAPGTGFLPIPDMFYQFHAHNRERINRAIRKAMAKDTKKRIEDDLTAAWHEEKVDGQAVFWHDGSADRRAGMLPTSRTVIFFDTSSGSDKEEGDRLIIAQTSIGAEDVVRRWGRLLAREKSRVKVPDSASAHWQARICWKNLYQFGQPYLVLLSSLAGDGAMPQSAEELGSALADSVINLKIEYAGLDARHVGPLPIGMIYVPAVAGEALSSTADPASEAARERVACQNLRVLYHHAKLFKADYGRWPSTVAELDGYVDFNSHPNLLKLRRKDDGFITGFTSMISARNWWDIHNEEGELDDSLYEIDWSPDAWKLKLRKNEFKQFETICIDQEGEIHRTAASEKAGRS